MFRVRVADEEAVDVERHPVGRNERARTVNEDGRVVRSLRLQTDRHLAEVVALDEPERLQRADAVGVDAVRDTDGPSAMNWFCVKLSRAHGFEMQNVASRPTGRDRCLTGELDVAAERRAETVDVNVLFDSRRPRT